jgi:hypothetical protein
VLADEVFALALALADTILSTVAATVSTPPPATGADASLVGAVSVLTYGESTAEGFLIIDTVNSPFDVFTAFALLFTPKKKHPGGA